MIKKILVLCLSYKLIFASGYPVTDLKAYTYYIEEINQMSKMIENTSTQIRTLGGVRTAVDESKRAIYDAKDTLEGSINNLQASIKDFEDATKNAEIKSLFSLSRDSITTNSTDGIMYKNIHEQIQSFFNKADKVIMSDMQRAKMSTQITKFENINNALSSNSIEDFNKHMGSKSAYNSPTKEDSERQRDAILIRNYLRWLQSQGKEAVQQMSLKMVNDIWSDYFVPNDEKLEEQKKRDNKIKKYIGYIENSTDLYQQTQTTNMILSEMLKVAKDEYRSALAFRNAMTLMYLNNTDNKQFTDLLKKKNDTYKKLKSGSNLDDQVKRSSYYDLKKANPYGFGWRPWK